MVRAFLKGCRKNFKSFFEWSVSYLEKHEKNLIIANTKSVTLDGDGLRCSGWCDGEEIVIARKNPLFERVYVHEFSHMNQAVEASPYWFEDTDFWDHLTKQKIQIKSWDEVLKVIAVERDCERRALLHSKHWGLFDNANYARQANLYLHYYQYVFLKQRWVATNKIYHPYLLKEMPEKLVPFSQLKNIDMNLMKLYDDCLDRKGKYYRKK